MTTQWVLRLPAEQSKSLSSLRLEKQIQASTLDQEIWLRGSMLDENLTRTLRSIPDSELFDLQKDAQLIPAGRHVPLGYLPDTEWLPLPEWLTVQLQAPALAGKTDDRISFELVRSQQNLKANVLLTTLVNLKKLVDCDSQIRLKPLQYAVDSQQRTIIRGAPLPSIEGSFFCEQKGIAVAAGWVWSPQVDVDVLHSLFKLNPGDVVLLHADQSREFIGADQFTPLTRSSVRLTLQRFDNTSSSDPV
ncbi:hypothetical protein F1728_06890 [Gimesia benthica]|uniref:MoxR-vWA-beta-propeller ternary system domain-containing protein n=1 Tax=Gimesia benthica TaxID=2608982 RepID=A0A6I6AAM9_9PLAN|nr:hypothetical protein [Gimesia benthica]QGQ22415.1 hypothetical protein F1728_06890 [Gimesia benthica]